MTELYRDERRARSRRNCAKTSNGAASSYAEYDVEHDAEALARMTALTNGERTVPVLVEDGRVVEIGYRGRGCVVGPG